MTDEPTEALRLSEKDARIRALIYATVAFVLNDHGPVDPERADREAHDIALATATILAKRIYDGDAELHALRAERDLYKDITERGLMLSRPALIVATSPLSPWGERTARPVNACDPEQKKGDGDNESR